MEKYRTEFIKDSWWVIGPRTKLGPYINRFKAERLVAELNENDKIREVSRNKAGD